MRDPDAAPRLERGDGPDPDRLHDDIDRTWPLHMEPDTPAAPDLDDIDDEEDW